VNIPGIRKAVLKMRPYEPGKTIEEVRRDLGLKHIIKLGSNENPYGPFPESIEAMKQEMSHGNRYPDIAFEEIKGLLAQKHGLKQENIAISHGAEGMLQSAAKTFIEEEDQVIIPMVTYKLYEELSKLMGAKIVRTPMKENTIDLLAVAKAVTEKTKLIWLCNPNNPTGTHFDLKDFSSLLDDLPEKTWVILDEAYAEFCPQDKLPNRAKLINEGKNIISVRTFSKAYGLAGLRLGYGMARPDVIRAIDTVSEPFNANRLAIAAGIAVLRDGQKSYTEALEAITRDRKRMEEALRNMECSVTPSSTNFVFFETPYDCSYLSQQLLKRGIIVRPCNIWGCDNAIRVTVGTSEEVDEFLKAIEDILKSALCSKETQREV